MKILRHISARIRSVGFALSGIWVMLKTQQNAWIHSCAAVAVIALGCLLNISLESWRWLVTAIIIVWVAEAFNTAFEFLADAVSPEFHPLIKQAKDVAAGAVLIAAVGAVIIGLLALGPPLLHSILE